MCLDGVHMPGSVTFTLLVLVVADRWLMLNSSNDGKLLENNLNLSCLTYRWSISGAHCYCDVRTFISEKLLRPQGGPHGGHYSCNTPANPAARACVHACVMPLRSLIIAGLTPTGQMAVWCSSLPRTVWFVIDTHQHKHTLTNKPHLQ